MLNELTVNFKNCYGIKSLNQAFKLSKKEGRSSVNSAYAIYAPNGLMKTSFAKTFADLAAGKQPKEERFGREASAEVLWGGAPIQPEQIYVLKAEVELNLNAEVVSNLLVNQEQKLEYDALIKERNSLQSKLETELQRASGVKKADIAATISRDMETNQDFVAAIQAALATEVTDDYSGFKYQDIFDKDAIAVLKSPDFLKQAEEFTEHYLNLFEQPGTIYKKGEFNPNQADTAITALERQGYFKPGHQVLLAGEAEPRDLQLLKDKLDEVNKAINENTSLKAIQQKLVKNAKTQAISKFFEDQSATTIELLLKNIKPSKIADFKKQLWAFYTQQTVNAKALLEDYQANKERLASIEQQAAQESDQWLAAIRLFNQRFIDMPFTLAVSNQADVALGKEPAKLVCNFKDTAEGQESNVKSFNAAEIEKAHLSQGERRAFYLLNFIFEVERRKQNAEPTLFIIDDPADSFDYKNKHAIVQYLTDLNEVEHFAQIILTHNFDFYRSLAAYVNRKRCFMANKTTQGIQLQEAHGVNNIFTKVWKPALAKENGAINEAILCATIPFTRNIIEYTANEENIHYLKLTSLLHWKEDSEQITATDYWNIYAKVFNAEQTYSNNQPMLELIFNQADLLTKQTEHDGLNLENKVLLSMAIRLQAEKYMTQAIRNKANNPDYWFSGNCKQYAGLIKKYKQLLPTSLALSSLEKVSVTVSSNIHLNSFMYEPILDLTPEHLISLYQEIKALG